MKRALVLIVAMSLLSCDLLKKSEPVPVTSNPIVPTVKSKPQDCPVSDSKKPALAKWTMSNGAQFHVCEMDYSTTPGENHFTGWVNVFHNDKGKLVPAINESATTKPSAFQSFSVQKISDSEILITRMVQVKDKNNATKSVKLTEKKISCKRENVCDFFEETCFDFKSQIPVNNEAIEKVKAIVSKKVQLKDTDNYDVVIDHVVRSALGGNAEAKDLIIVTPASDLQVDGAAAESYHDGLILLSNLQSIKCI